MVMIAFVGLATFDNPGKGATSILQAVIFSKSEAPVEEHHTGTFLLLLRFLRSFAWCGCRCTRFSDCGVMTYTILRDSCCSPHRSKHLGEEALLCLVEWSREGKPIATLALQVVVLGLLQPPADI